MRKFIIFLSLLAILGCNKKSDIVTSDEEEVTTLDLGFEEEKIYNSNPSFDYYEKSFQSQDSASYWYVFVELDNSSAYTFMKQSTRYFDIIDAIKRVKKNNSGVKYVGISFYKQIPLEMYEKWRN